MENLKEKENSFFEIAHIDYEYVKNSEYFQNDELLQTLAESPHFKSLEDKTQVTQRFLCEKDVSTRLSHTFQVMKLTKEIAEIKGADVQTAVRIAAFHDCGHVPFGHIGERVMGEIIHNIIDRPTILGDMIGYDERQRIKLFRDFNHEMISARIFDKILRENNLEIPQYQTILEGILKHGGGLLNSETKEGQIVGIADKISYLVQDIKDSQKIGWALKFPKHLGHTPEQILDTLLLEIKVKAKDEDFFNKDVLDELNKLRKYMYTNFYASSDFDILDRMFGNTLQFVFLDWCSEMFELREDIKDGLSPEYQGGYCKFFNLKKGENLKEMLNFNKSFLQFLSLSDDEIMQRSDFGTKEILKKRTENYKNLEIIQKYCRE